MKKFLRRLKAFAFKRKRRFYIFLIVICTLVLLLDIGVGKLMPSMSGFTQMPGTTSDVTLPDSSGDTDFDTSDIPDMDGEMPSGDFGGSDDASSEDSTDSDDSTDSENSTDSDDSADADSTSSSGDAAVISLSSEDSTDTSDSSSSDSDSSESSSDSSSDMPDTGEMPSGEMPSGDSAGEMPSMGEGMPGSSDSDSSESSDDSSDSTDSDADSDSSDSTGSVSGIQRVFAIITVVQKIWIPIAVIAALIDAGSICMLILLRRKKKRDEEIAEQIRMAELIQADGEVHLARPEQKKKKMTTKSWIILLAAIVVLVVIVKVFSSQLGDESSQTEATTYTETASTGDISTTLPGTGTLTEEDAVEVSLPSEVEITEWYVSDGDAVSEGDAIAAVDTDSALQAIASVQETIDALDDELSSVESEDTTGTVTAAAAGRVKAIYAESGTSVIDTMYESESLIVLSLDGLMAVSFGTEEEVTVGDEVTVTLSDGTEEEGEIESSIGGTVVVTLTDNGTTLGDSVTVTDSDGTQIGSGELYVHSELKVMAFSGTVSSISVSVNEKVSSGDTLLSLEDIDNTLEIQLLVEQRNELEEQIETLFTLYQEGYLYASADGVVSGIDSDDSTSSSEEDSESDDTSSDDESSSDDTESSEDSDSGTTGTSSSSASGSVTVLALTASGSSSSASADGAGESYQALSLAEDTDSDDDSDAGSTDSSTDADSTEDTEGSTSDSGSGNYLGIVTAVDGSTVSVNLYSISGSVSSDSTSGTFSLDDTSVYICEDGSLSSGSSSDIAVGDTLVLICSSDASADDLSPVCVIRVSSSSSDSSGEDGTGSESTGGQEQADGQQGSDSQVAGTVENVYGTTGTEDASSLYDSETGTVDTSSMTEAEASAAETLEETVDSTYSVAETTLLSITPQDSMYITITIDELDILSLSEGLEAEVTLDAFPGQSFTGEVESIDLSGSNSGGNSKYTAVVKISREDDMLAGMNASVKITLDTAEDVLCIPAEALVEDETGTYVYTSYDESTDTLGDLVEVETGISDGISVEITSGLSEGDTYYYSVLDTVNYSTAAVTGGSGLNFGSMFGGGGF